jgi:hypothetical protein
MSAHHAGLIMRAVLLLSTLLWTSAASAQSTSTSLTSDPMMAVCSGLLTEGGSGITGKDKLCSCLINQVTANLTAEEMSAYATANLKSQAPLQEVTDKVTAIATRCLSQAR